MKSFRKYIFIISGLTLILFVGKFILFDYSFIPEKSNQNVSIENFPSLSGDSTLLPIAINTISTGEGELIPWTIAAGDRDVPNSYIQTSFQIVYENYSIVLDAPMVKSNLTISNMAGRFLKISMKFFKKPW
jgi:hypothetical protein